MIIPAWRITKRKFAQAALDGEGARLYGGRWNSPGTRMVYVAQSRALAVLEVLVHLDSRALLDAYVLIGVELDSSQITNLDLSTLPFDWQMSPATVSSQRIGDDWAAAKASVALRVPSTLVGGEFNFLLNPEHPEFRAALTVFPPEPYQFDPRFVSTG